LRGFGIINLKSRETIGTGGSCSCRWRMRETLPRLAVALGDANSRVVFRAVSAKAGAKFPLTRRETANH